MSGMSEIEITRPEYEALLERRRELREKLKEVWRRAGEAAWMGDLRENSPYERARRDYEVVESQLREISQRIERSRVVEASSADGGVQVGCRVRLRLDGEEEVFHISLKESGSVGRVVSPSSPLGKSLLGQRERDSFVVETPDGEITVEILEVHPEDD